MGGLQSYMLLGYWWAICRLTYRLHSLICQRHTHTHTHRHTHTHTHTHIHYSELCHSCSDSVITPVSGWKMGLYVKGSAGRGVTFSSVPWVQQMRPLQCLSTYCYNFSSYVCIALKRSFDILGKGVFFVFLQRVRRKDRYQSHVCKAAASSSLV